MSAHEAKRHNRPKADTMSEGQATRRPLTPGEQFQLGFSNHCLCEGDCKIGEIVGTSFHPSETVPKLSEQARLPSQSASGASRFNLIYRDPAPHTSCPSPRRKRARV